MKRVLLKSAAFVRAAKRLVKKNPDMASVLQATLNSLAEDAFCTVFLVQWVAATEVIVRLRS